MPDHVSGLSMSHETHRLNQCLVYMVCHPLKKRLCNRWCVEKLLPFLSKLACFELRSLLRMSSSNWLDSLAHGQAAPRRCAHSYSPGPPPQYSDYAVSLNAQANRQVRQPGALYAAEPNEPRESAAYVSTYHRVC